MTEENKILEEEVQEDEKTEEQPEEGSDTEESTEDAFLKEEDNGDDFLRDDGESDFDSGTSEISTQTSGKIKDVMLEMSLSDTNVSIDSTPIINGHLEMIKVSSPVPVSVKVVLEDYPKIELLDIGNFVGDNCFVTRVQPINKDREFLNMTQTKWALNDKLKVIVTGQKGHTVFVLIRYS